MSKRLRILGEESGMTGGREKMSESNKIRQKQKRGTHATQREMYRGRKGH